MSHRLESQQPRVAPPAADVVVLPAPATEASAAQAFLIAARPAGLASPAGQSGTEQWLQSFLAQLRPSESLSLRIALRAGAGLSFGAVACAPRSAVGARARELEGALRGVLTSALPHLKLAADCAERGPELANMVDLEPAGQRIALDELARMTVHPVTTSSAAASGAGPAAPVLRFALSPERRPDLSAVADLMSRPDLEGAVLDLELSSFRLDARHRRALQEFLKRLVTHTARTDTGIPLVYLNDRVLQQLKGWSAASCGLRLTARLSSAEAVSPVLLDMMCQALFGATRCTEGEQGDVNLAASWPEIDLSFLERMPAIPAAKMRLDARRSARSKARARAIVLGALDDAPFAIDAMARQQHVYMLGGTGTGKSTLMLNMIHQDMKAGRGVILIDPHGDLWEKALKLVPANRMQDLVLVHPTDPRGAFTMNVLERLGDDTEGEHSRIINELLDFLKRSQWREVPEAFGPMFENYFRNGLQLLLGSEGDQASILDFQRVFSDDSYRRKLLDKCPNKEVVSFWRDIIARADYEAKLSNHAPYIVCKMAPITGNPHLRRILGANHSSLDFGKVIAEQQICLINLAQPHLSKEASRFLGGLITARLVASAKVTQVALPDDQRKRANVYMDEFQTYISAGLADGLAEVRKYGLNLVLANQSLSQLQGDRYQAEVAEAVMSNAANVIAFRVGIADAARLARRFEPELAATTLAKLPNYYAAGLVVRGSAIAAPEVFATKPEPKPPRRRRPAATLPCASPLGLERVRAILLGLIGRRAQPPPAAD